MAEYRRALDSIQKLKYEFRKNYGGTVRIGANTLKCYTKKQLSSLHPQKDYRIVAESAQKGKDAFGTLEGEIQLPAYRYRSHNRFLFREKGYLALEGEEGKYVSLLQTVWPQRIAAIALCAVLVLVGAFFALNTVNPVSLQDGSVPAAAAPKLDSNAVDWNGVKSTATGTVVPGIAIPGFKSITIDAGTKDANVNFSNPKDNPCYFEISLLLEDGTVLYKSDMIKPGQGIYNIKLSQTLKAGTYNATLKYDTFSLDKLEPMNGAAVKIQLIAQ